MLDAVHGHRNGNVDVAVLADLDGFPLFSETSTSARRNKRLSTEKKYLHIFETPIATPRKNPCAQLGKKGLVDFRIAGFLA